MDKIYVYDLSNTVWICKDKAKNCVFFPIKPFRKYTLLTLIVYFLKEWEYDVVLHTEFEDIAWMKNDIHWKKGTKKNTTIQLTSFDKEGTSRINRLLANDPKFKDGLFDFDFPESMIPDEDSYLGKVLNTRLKELASLCKKEKEGINLKGE